MCAYILKSVCLKAFEWASVTEWSKVLRSGRSVFARVGSSPTACIFLYSLLMDRILTDWHEVLYYDAIYASVTNESQNELGGKEAVTFLKKSGLPISDIKSVGNSKCWFTKDMGGSDSWQVVGNRYRAFSHYSSSGRTCSTRIWTRSEFSNKIWYSSTTVSQ